MIMSTEQQNGKGAGALWDWVFKVLTGMGAIFLFGVFQKVNSTHEVLESMRRESAGRDAEVRMTLQQHENRLRDHDQELKEHRRVIFSPHTSTP
jgi:hypothetical protein